MAVAIDEVTSQIGTSSQENVLCFYLASAQTGEILVR